MKKMKLSALSLGTALAMTFASQAAHAGVMVHLFQWKYNDIANECEKVLGPKGYDAVQITPPAEHIQGSSWWVVYQPVNYKNFTSLGGNEAELKSMISRCHAAGVKIYADAVFNQMAGGSGTGTGGSSYSSRNYPAFSASDFHSVCDITDYSNRWQVQNCSLPGLPDLNTGSSYVQGQITTYLKTLAGWGVDGFRIDAAKHMSTADLGAIYSQAGNPFIYQEVIGATGEPIQPGEYTGLGVVTEFKYGTDLASNFKGQIKNLKTLGESWGLLASDKAEVFVVNHDRERGHGGGGMLTYKDGALYNLANVFMLAWSYGKYPQVFSGYDYGTNTDIGGPSAAVCSTGSTWNCEHRWGNIANMVSFHNAVQGTAMANWWDNGNNQIAFGRGAKGFVVINNETTAMTQSLQTGLPAGTYCNILAGNELCSGSNITVDSAGKATFTVGAKQAAAIHINAKACSTNCPVTPKFTSMYFRGTSNSWAAAPMTVDATTRVWSTEVTFTGAADSTGTQRFKFDVYGNWTENYGDTEADGIADKGSTKDIYFSGVGKYKVALKESDLSYTLTKMDTNQAPVAVVSPKTISVKVGDSIVFDASGSTDDNGVTGYSWSTGGSAKTETVLFDTVGTKTISVTVTDAQGLTSTASATVTVTDNNGAFNSAYTTMNFRGTPNSWASMAMTLVADNTWEATVNFDGQANQRFKFDVAGNWTTNFGDTNADGTANQGGSDIYTAVVGTYKVQFNDSTLKYSLTKIGGTSYTAKFASLYFRGTPNSWGSTAMKLVADNTWQADVTFTGAGDATGSQRFKFDVKGDWTQNYGDTNKDGTAELTGADITSSVVGTYTVTFNDSTLKYTLTAK